VLELFLKKSKNCWKYLFKILKRFRYICEKYFCCLSQVALSMKRNFIFFVCFIVWAQAVLGQLTTNGIPKSRLLNLSVQQIPQVNLPFLDISAVKEEENRINPENTLPPKFGTKIQVNFNSKDNGLWTNIPDGKIWRMRIHSPGAKSLSVHLSKFNLKPGVELFFYDFTQNYLIGAITERNNNLEQSLHSIPLQGDELVLEMFVPTRVQNQDPLYIDYVVHDYVGIFNIVELYKDLQSRGGDCFVDVNCPLGTPYSDVAKSVGLLVVDGERWCSGAMVNNTTNDHTPYFLTANHCFVENSNISSWTVVFNYQSKNCNEITGVNTLQSIEVGNIRARQVESDFMLLELKFPPPTDWGIYYAGWSRMTEKPKNAAVIHHPFGGLKKISLTTNAPVNEIWNGLSPELSYKVRWTEGVTGVSSSGAPLFNENKLIIGQLRGGESSCDNLTGYDYFGTFSKAWNGGNSASTRLSDWLNPTQQPYDGQISGSYQSVLPVNLLNFYGKSHGAVNNLYWKTAAEENIERYQLEKLNDQGIFEPIGSVSAKQVVTEFTYMIEDKSPLLLNYYRLTILEKDNSSHTSKIILVRNNNILQDGFKIYPNPATDFVSISIPPLGGSNIYSIDIHDISGKICLHTNLSAGENFDTIRTNLDISALPKGYYSITISNGYISESQKLMK